jgi:hypothetical protein
LACFIASRSAHHLKAQETLQLLIQALECTLQLNTKQLTSEAIAQGKQGVAIGQWVNQARLEALISLLGI